MRKTFPLISIGIGFLLLTVAIGYSVYLRAIQNPFAAPLPTQLSGLSLTTSTTGKRAVEEIAQLHGLDFPLTSGAVGRYGANQQAILWTAGTIIQPMATNLVSAMNTKIAEGDSPFTPERDRLEGKRMIYELEGMGQKHFYFQSNRLVIWLAANPEIAEGALRQVLEFYP